MSEQRFFFRGTHRAELCDGIRLSTSRDNECSVPHLLLCPLKEVLPDAVRSTSLLSEHCYRASDHCDLFGDDATPKFEGHVQMLALANGRLPMCRC